MSEKTAEEIQGYEYDWIACDEYGRVAMFSTAGGGYAPRAFLADTDKYDEALEALMERDVFTSARQAPTVAEGLANTWKELAERGVFSYDSDPLGGPYRLVGVPEAPVLCSALDPAVSDVVRRVELGGIELGKDETITREDIIRSEID